MKTYAFLLRTAMLALSLASVSLLSSCYNDDAEECPPNDNPVTVRLNVSAAQIGDLNGTRAGGDANAYEHEFINTLKVYIVNNTTGITVQDLSPDLTADGLALTGDMTEWHSAPITIAPGKYTVYAFANVEKYDGEYGAEPGTGETGKSMLQNCFEVGKQFKKDDLNSYRIDDPAGRIDLENGMYIPMSGMSEELVLGDLNAGGNDVFTVYLDRLVSKVNMTVGADLPEKVNPSTTIKFSNYSEKVPLMAGTNTTHGERTAKTQSWSLLNDAMQTGDSYQLSFYVNETPKVENQGFTVTLNTGNASSGGISEYKSVTNRDELPRNSVYPLTLVFPTYSPKFEWQAWAAPIGAYGPVVAEPEPGTYTVKIAEAQSRFEFSVIGVENGELQSAEWIVPEETRAHLKILSKEGNTLSAAMEGGIGVGAELPLSVTVTWTGTGNEEGRTMTRTYNVIIRTIDLTDVVYMLDSNGTRSGASEAYWLNREYLNMFKLK